MDVYVARQPIFNRKKNVVAYELLYRNSRANFFNAVDGDSATTALVANSLLAIGLDTLIENRKAFINFTFSHLKQDTPFLFPKNSLVIEILESITPDKQLLDICKSLKAQGFIIALDDFAWDGISLYADFFPYIDIIKVDFMKTSEDEQKEITKQLSQHKLTFLAEKVEKRSEFESAVQAGYSLFQGYFFSKPIIIDGKSVTPSKFAQFQMLTELSQPQPDVNVLSEITGRDLALSYKVLRLVNSAAFKRTSEIKSIKQALVHLGIRELQKLISFVIVRDLGADQPDELVWIVLIRAKFGEGISKLISYDGRDSEVFLMGLFSCIDVFFNKPIDEIVTKLPLAKDVKDALIGKENSLSKILQTIISYEKGEWDRFADLSAQLQLDREQIINLYINAVNWANQIKNDTSQPQIHK